MKDSREEKLYKKIARLILAGKTNINIEDLICNKCYKNCSYCRLDIPEIQRKISLYISKLA
jgi:hypothetical protein